MLTVTLTPVHDVYRPHVNLAVIGVNCENHIVKVSDVTLFLSSHQNKDQLWKQVETTLSNHNVEQILDSLVRQSQQGAQLLREHTMKISIHKDEQKLRYIMVW